MGTKVPVAIVLLIAVQVEGAAGVEWTLKAVLSEAASYDDNRTLAAVPPGVTYGLTTGALVTLAGRTPASRLDVITNLSYPYHFGPGAVGLNDALRFATSVDYEKRAPSKTFTLSGSLASESTTVSELIDSGQISVDATRISHALKVGITHDANELNSLSLSGEVAGAQFSGNAGSLHPYSSMGVTGSWNRKLTRRAGFTATLGASRFEPSDGSASNTYTATFGLQASPTRLLSFSASAGTRATVTSGATTFGLVWDVASSYKLKNTTVSLTAAQTATPSSLGVVQSTTSANLNLIHLVNEQARASLSIGYTSFASSAQPDRQVVVVSPTYSYQLNRKTDLQLSYTFTARLGGSGPAQASSIVGRLSRTFDVLP